MLHPFSLKSLNDLDGGRVAIAYRQAVDRCVKDCKDRPALDKPRKVTLSFEVMPAPDDTGDLVAVSGTFQVKENLPERKSKAYSFGVKHNGQLFFSDESPENVSQYTFDDVNPETGRAERPFVEEEEDSEPE